MASLNKRPIIFPLSNPVSLSEVDYADAVEWYVEICRPSLLNWFDHFSLRTNGAVVFASGSPYESIEFKGKKYEPSQGNNMYIFPGLGLGTLLSKARHVTDLMVEQASIALSASLTQEEKDVDLVYPRLIRIREISARIAVAVIRAAQTDVSGRLNLVVDSGIDIFFSKGVDESTFFRDLPDDALLETVKSKQWHPTTHRTPRL